MEIDPQDQEVIRQLRKLKQAEKQYPPELLTARRQRFLQQMSQISLGMGAGASIRQAVKSAKAPLTTPVTSKLLETVLVVAIIAEAGAVTYFYRDKVAELLKNFVASGEVQEIISPSSVNTPLITTIDTLPSEDTLTPVVVDTATPQLSIVSEVPTEVAVTSTQTPGLSALDATQPVNTAAAQVDSTPDLSGINDNNGNNGNHYGQTPKPERTKENNGNNDKPPKDDPPKQDPPKEDEKHPKDNKPPKDDSKPPKSK